MHYRMNPREPRKWVAESDIYYVVLVIIFIESIFLRRRGKVKMVASYANILNYVISVGATFYATHEYSIESGKAKIIFIIDKYSHVPNHGPR